MRTGRVSRTVGRKPKLRLRPTVAVAVAAAILAAALLLISHGYAQARRDPAVRSVRLAYADWPQDTPPLRLLLMSDAHVQGPDMPPDRLARIVVAANKLEADIVVLAGDYTSSSYFPTRTYTFEEAVYPLRLLNAKVAKVAILGNHDRNDPAESKAALERVGLTVLEDEAIQIGPLAIGGVHWGMRKALNRLRAREGIKILVGHGPDPFARLPADVSLMLAGHTHCGQIILPFVGPLATGSRYGTRYMCGLTRRPDSTLVVTAGLGTSRVPLRYGAPPDIWLIILGPLPATIARSH